MRHLLLLLSILANVVTHAQSANTSDKAHAGAAYYIRIVSKATGSPKKSSEYTWFALNRSKTNAIEIVVAFVSKAPKNNTEMFKFKIPPNTVNNPVNLGVLHRKNGVQLNVTYKVISAEFIIE